MITKQTTRAVDKYILELEDFPVWEKYERKHQGLTMFDVSEKSGMERTYIAKLESGRIASPKINTTLYIAEALGYDVRLVLTKRAENESH